MILVNLRQGYIGKENMNSKYNETLKRHISTHTVRSAEDRSAVSYLESVLNPDKSRRFKEFGLSCIYSI